MKQPGPGQDWCHECDKIRSKDDMNEKGICNVCLDHTANDNKRDPREGHGGEDRTFEDHRSNELED